MQRSGYVPQFCLLTWSGDNSLSNSDLCRGLDTSPTSPRNSFLILSLSYTPSFLPSFFFFSEKLRGTWVTWSAPLVTLSLTATYALDTSGAKNGHVSRGSHNALSNSGVYSDHVPVPSQRGAHKPPFALIWVGGGRPVGRGGVRPIPVPSPPGPVPFPLLPLTPPTFPLLPLTSP